MAACQNGFTVSLWIFLREKPFFDNNPGCLVCTREFTISHYGLDYVQTWVAFKTPASQRRRWITQALKTYEQRWFHLAVTWHPDDSLKLYINGELKSKSVVPHQSLWSEATKDLTFHYI